MVIWAAVDCKSASRQGKAQVCTNFNGTKI